jgi:hypothetical protein
VILPNATTKAGPRPQIYLFLFFQALYALTASGNVARVPDELEVYFQVEHFVDAGDLSVPQTLAIRQPVIVDGKVVGSSSIFFGKMGRDKKPYAPYGPLAALLTLPYHLAARTIALLLDIERMPVPAGLAWFYVVGALTSLATSTAAALAVVGFFRAALALGSTVRVSLALSMLLGLGTVLWVYGTSLYSEAFVAAALIWAAALLLEARAHPDPTSARARISIAAFLLVIAGLTKPMALVFAPGFVLGVLAASSIAQRVRIQVAVVLATAVAVAGLFHLTWNAQRFGNPLDFGYDCCDTVPVKPWRPFAVEDVPRGLAVLLLTPGKSLLLWAPPLLLALTRVRRLWQTDRALALGLVVSAGAALVFYASYIFPEGGYSHGPRHLVPLVPLLFLPAANPTARPLSHSAMLATGAVGLVIALLAVTVSYLQDQALGADLAQSGPTSYYEKIDPAPGRPWNRYAPAYIPFLRTFRAGSWTEEGQPGVGPDFIPYLLHRVRVTASDGREIPAWFPYVVALPWVVLLAWSAPRLRRIYTRDVPPEKTKRGRS